MDTGIVTMDRTAPIRSNELTLRGQWKSLKLGILQRLAAFAVRSLSISACVQLAIILRQG
jgi:hypothetical protein